MAKFFLPIKDAGGTGETLTLSDSLAVEEPLDLRIGFGPTENRRREALSITMRTPGDDFDLAVGFLFTEGIIADFSNILSLRFLEENALLAELSPTLHLDFQRFKRNFYTSSSCGICGKASLDAVQTVACFRPIKNFPMVNREVIFSLPEKLRQSQDTFETTGGLHAAGLFDQRGNLLFLREDIGRHNAVDKVIGAALRAGVSLPFLDKILMVSGRAGFELVQKSLMAGLPILAAVGAASSLAVELAAESGMTLIGFLRGERFNVYSFPERLS